MFCMIEKVAVFNSLTSANDVITLSCPAEFWALIRQILPFSFLKVFEKG